MRGLPGSLPFIILLLLGVVIGNKSLMGLGADGGGRTEHRPDRGGHRQSRLLPFRDSPIQGVLFLIPPFTFFYLYSTGTRCARPVNGYRTHSDHRHRRGGLFVEPWLRGEGK